MNVHRIAAYAFGVLLLLLLGKIAFFGVAPGKQRWEYETWELGEKKYQNKVEEMGNGGWEMILSRRENGASFVTFKRPR